MKRLLFLLLFLSSCLTNLSAEKYPNVLVISFKDKEKEELVLPLEDTQLKFLPSYDGNHLLMINNQINEIRLSDIQSITYDYDSDVAMGIRNIDSHEDIAFSVYRLDGKCVFKGNSFQQSFIESLPQGFYVIKAYGRTYKIIR